MIIFLPELFLWSLILPQQTQNFLCIHSEPFVHEKERGLNQRNLLEGKLENISKAAETTSTVLPDRGTTFCNTYRPMGNLVYKGRLGQWMFGRWRMSVTGTTTEACKVKSLGAIANTGILATWLSKFYSGLNYLFNHTNRWWPQVAAHLATK